MSLGVGPLRFYFGHSRRRMQGPTWAQRNKARELRRQRAEVAARIANWPSFTVEELAARDAARGSRTPKADAMIRASRVHHSAYAAK